MLKFGLTYKEISFELELTLEKNKSTDPKFDKYSSRTKKSLLNGDLAIYSLIINSKKDEFELVHYIGNILLIGKDEELLADLEKYLDDESIIENIVKIFEEMSSKSPLPPWARNKKGS